jgi:hypothetical protein
MWVGGTDNSTVHSKRRCCAQRPPGTDSQARLPDRWLTLVHDRKTNTPNTQAVQAVRPHSETNHAQQENTRHPRLQCYTRPCYQAGKATTQRGWAWSGRIRPLFSPTAVHWTQSTAKPLLADSHLIIHSPGNLYEPLRETPCIRNSNLEEALRAFSDGSALPIQVVLASREASA